jgi:hypothetical protein
MPYLEDLIAQIKDREKWPDFDRGDFLIELNEIADDAYSKHTIEGYLAALLVYHQLIEESLRLVLRWCEFFMQLQLAPTEYHIKLPKKAMFGQIVEEVRKTIDFDHRDELVALAEKVNGERIQLVHGLTKHESIETLSARAKEIKNLFDGYFVKFDDVRDWFLLVFKDLRKDGEWDQLIEEE